MIVSRADHDDGDAANEDLVLRHAKRDSLDMHRMRREEESGNERRTLRRVSALIEEVNRKWPFQRDTEIRLP